MRKQLLYLSIALSGILSHAQLECPTMISPPNGSLDISSPTIISWSETPSASGYLLTLGSSPTADDILSKTIYMVNYSEEIIFPNNATIYVTITPFNDMEIASGCPKWSFSTPQECDFYINPKKDISVCYTENVGTNEIFVDFASIERELIGAQEDLLLTYYDLIGNAIDLNQLLPNPNSSPYTLLVKASDTNGCLKETIFSLRLVEPPIVEVLEDINVCESFALPVLSTNNSYFTGPNGTGSELQAGSRVTNSQLIYILNQVGSCMEQSSFRINIDPLVCAGQTSAKQFPKFFTPNGDGINDFWQLNRSELNITEKSPVFIYDRYGKLVRMLEFDSQGWDGNYEGSPMPSSDYWFFVNLGNNKSLSGHFSLKR
ncbi:MAG: T9SS type B sorting domain-containing protein [Arenibacter algicola]